MNYQPSTPELLRVAGLPEDTPIDTSRPDYRKVIGELNLARKTFSVECTAQQLGKICSNCVSRAERMCDLADKVYAEHGIRVITASEKAAKLAAKAVDYTPPPTEVPTTPASFQ